MAGNKKNHQKAAKKSSSLPNTIKKKQGIAKGGSKTSNDFSKSFANMGIPATSKIETLFSVNSVNLWSMKNFFFFQEFHRAFKVEFKSN